MDESRALTTIPHRAQIAPVQFTPSEIEVLKSTICKDSTDEELKLFGMVCSKTGLDPFAR